MKESMSDLINRRAAMVVIECSGLDDDSKDTVVRVLEQLPSAQPEDKCGECDAWNQYKNYPRLQWIPCSERLPERIINGEVETVQEFFVTVKERWPGEEWSYHTDVAEFPGDYIDDIWQTYNDWREGQEVHVIAWMPLPEPYEAERRPMSDFAKDTNVPTNDCISRQAAIDVVMITPQEWDGMYIQDLNCRLRDALNALPSPQSEQSEMIKDIRKWINSGNRGNADYLIVDKIEEIINKYE